MHSQFGANAVKKIRNLILQRKDITLSLTDWVVLEKYLEGIEAALMKYSERDIEEN